jgi:hypothetical protein
MTADREPSGSSSASDSPGDDEVDETHEIPVRSDEECARNVDPTDSG